MLTENQNVQVQVLIKKICNFFNDAARAWYWVVTQIAYYIYLFIYFLWGDCFLLVTLFCNFFN